MSIEDRAGYCRTLVENSPERVCTLSCRNDDAWGEGVLCGTLRSSPHVCNHAGATAAKIHSGLSHVAAHGSFLESNAGFKDETGDSLADR